MKIYQLLHNLVDKFAPMSEADSINLLSKSSSSYGLLVNKANKILEDNAAVDLYNYENMVDIDEGKLQPKVVKPLPLDCRAVLLCEKWFMQYVFAILFIILVPKLKAYINGEKSDKDFQPDNEFEDFMAYKRFKNGF